MATATLTPAPAAGASVVKPVRFTVEEFDEMGSMGLFEGRRAILIDGAVLEQGPMNPPHAMGIVLVQEAFRTIFGTGWVIRIQLPLNLDRFNDPMSDFAVVAGHPRDFAVRHPDTAALIVEVADSTLAFDESEKAERYAKAGIADYWILDVQGKRLIVHRDPDRATSTYASVQDHAPTDHISPLAMPGGSILVADLLP